MARMWHILHAMNQLRRSNDVREQFPPISTPGGSVELSLLSVGPHFPRSVSAGERCFEVLEFNRRRAVVVVRGDDDLLASDVDLVDEVLEELVAGLHGVNGGLCEALVERADGVLVLEQRRLE